MGKKTEIFLPKEFQIIYVDTPSLRRESTTSHLLSVGCASWLPSKDYSMEKMGGVTSQWRNLTNITSARWFRSTPTVISHAESILPLTWQDEMAFSVVFTSSPVMRKNIRQISVEWLPTNCLDQNSSKLSGSQKTRKVWETGRAEGSLRRCANQTKCGIPDEILECDDVR